MRSPASIRPRPLPRPATHRRSRLATSLPVLGCILILVLAALGRTVDAHDLFLKLERYALPAHTKVSIALVNGTFDRSENVITRDRMQGVRILGPTAASPAVRPPASAWRDVEDTTVLDFETGAPGTYVLGVSTKPRVLEMSAEDFNAYLEHDGVLDTLEHRRSTGRLDEPARERYSKHVKAVYRVGGDADAPPSEAVTAASETGTHGIALGYPIEILPLEDPTDLAPGDSLRVRILLDGKPLPNQRVYASHEGHHAHDESGRHTEAVQARTDAEGIAAIELAKSGRWYVRLIHMREVDEPDVDYESNWATLTFAVR